MGAGDAASTVYTEPIFYQRHTNRKWNVTQNCSPVLQLQLRNPSAREYEATFIRKTIKN